VHQGSLGSRGIRVSWSWGTDLDLESWFEEGPEKGPERELEGALEKESEGVLEKESEWVPEKWPENEDGELPWIYQCRKWSEIRRTGGNYNPTLYWRGARELARE
jgi:hypothetical protein